MKFRIIILLTIVCIAVLSCSSSIKQEKIDLSSFGSVNMIKEIDEQVYVLNSTASSIYKLDEDSLSLFRDLKICGRDFLLDFDIQGEKVYYSNTYDEIFVSSDSVIEDTIRVFNPDRIAVRGSKLFITSRKAEDGYIYLKMIDIMSKNETARVRLNDMPETEMKFAQVSITEVPDGLWVMNPFRSKLEKYDSELNMITDLELPEGYQYGNFKVQNGETKIIASKDGQIAVLKIKDGKFNVNPVINSTDIDIMTSLVCDKKAIIYNYIDQSIIL